MQGIGCRVWGLGMCWCVDLTVDAEGRQIGCRVLGVGRGVYVVGFGDVSVC